ncbi:hypothetical protein GGF40_001666 [Coemansia sp. RSA 1286]|nr:hypothetical protein GGF40_001666 [Coemansia sp. RSA 1286]
MSPAMAASKRHRPPTITTIEEYDKNVARKRAVSINKRQDHQKDHTHHDHTAKECETDHKHRSGCMHKNQSNCDHASISSGSGSWLLSKTRHFMKAIMSDGESRSIFMFLLLNLSYMVVQVIYGYITNSLGLISDAIHMLFDCMALAIGLIAAVMSKWPPSDTFTMGYDRIEILSGFANGVFLMLISVSIFFEAIERLIYPPEMDTRRLLLVSFGGLVVNLFGILAFNGHHHHHHGSGACSHSHSHDHKHEHEHEHEHKHHGGHTHHRSQNMQGVFLHVLADTLGSVGVIISTLLIQQFGWTGFDPLASIIIAALIFASVVPLVRDSMHILLLRLPDHSQAEVQMAVDEIHSSVASVTDMTRVQFWPVTENQIMGLLIVRIDTDKVNDRDELPLCQITVRKDVSSSIKDIIRKNVSGLRDVFVHIEGAE